MFDGVLRAFKDKRRVLELVIGLVLLAASILADTRGLFTAFENLFLDIRFQVRGERAFPEDIRFIGIDEASLDVFGRWPWSRDKHAILLGILRNEQFRPAVLGYDLLFESRDQNKLEGDDNLVHQVKSFPNPLIMPYFFEKGTAMAYERNEKKEEYLLKYAIPESGSRPSRLEEAHKASLPFIELTELSHLAFVNAPTDPDGRTRRAQLLVKYRDRVYPSLDFLCVLYFLGATPADVELSKNEILVRKTRKGELRIPVSPEGDMLINYYGDSVGIPSNSYVHMLTESRAWMEGGSAPEGLQNLKDKIVLIGVSALGLEDRRVTPFHQYEPGISIHAQAIATILEQNYLVHAPRAVSFTIIAVLGLLTIACAMVLKIGRSLPLIAGVLCAYLAASQALFNTGIWVDIAGPALAILLVFAGISSFRYFTALEELKRTQDQLIHSAKMASLGQLSAGIAHEFRNILHAIGLHVEYCARPGTDPEKITKNLARVKPIIDNANAVLNGLLTFARKNESNKTPGNLKKTVEDTLLLVEKELMSHQIIVETELVDIPQTSYDAGQLSQVIMNLMNNARDALKDEAEKKVTLKLSLHNGQARLDIGDNGSGIPPKVLKHLFEPFVTSKPAGKGTGLGLSVCHGIIRNHGGDIKVTTAQGKGTTWHIYLPMTRRQEDTEKLAA